MASINEVKQLINNLNGKSVDCIINKGRNKLVKLMVRIDQVYPSMFVIAPLENVSLDRKSFSYNDVMCGDIKFLN